jgi:2-phospho-L-lactate/phosphoenolpyruvate guanylyltransferase
VSREPASGNVAMNDLVRNGWRLCHNRSEGCYAVVAIKRRANCKSRLATALDAPARMQLVRLMLDHMLKSLSEAQTIRHVVVLSPERDTVSTGISVLTDSGDGLNEALGRARKALFDAGARELLILPADLPRVSSADIDLMVHAGRAGKFAIAPDARGRGTNALFLESHSPFAFCFGDDSKRLHLKEAGRLGLSKCIVQVPGLALDVDLPGDLKSFVSQTASISVGWMHPSACAGLRL